MTPATPVTAALRASLRGVTQPPDVHLLIRCAVLAMALVQLVPAMAAVASRAIARGQCARLLSPRTLRIGGSFQRRGAEHHVARLLSTSSSSGGDASTGPRVVLEGRIDGRLQPRTCAIDAAFTESRLYVTLLALLDRYGPTRSAALHTARAGL